MRRRNHDGAETLYRCLLYALPPSFRRAHEEEMLAWFREHREGAMGKRGLPARARFWTAILADWIRTLMVQHGAAAAGLAHHLATRRASGRSSGLQSVIHEVHTDLRFAARTFARSPTFTLAAILTLTLGIGATTAIFSVVDVVLLRPLPYPESGSLVRVLHNPPGDDDVTVGAFSREDFADLQSEGAGYESMAAYRRGTIVLTGEGEPAELAAAYISSGFFQTLGIHPALGRAPDASENVPGQDRVAVLSDGLWRSRFASDSAVVGRAVTFDGAPFTVVGVMPPGFDFPSPEADAWIPISLIGCDNFPCGRNQRFMRVIARLAPGTSLEGADTATDAALYRLAEAFPETNAGWHEGTLVSLHASLVGDVRPQLLLLLGAVTLVLVIACANVANLILARGTTRGPEFAIRVALGADRPRMIRQLLIESVALALVGGALGSVLAVWAGDGLLALSGGTIPRLPTVRADIRVLSFAVAASVLTGLMFGLLPALTASRVEIAHRLITSRVGGASAVGKRAVRRVLIGGEMALAVVLLAGAGLLLKSLWNLAQVDTGVTTENVVVLSIDMSADVMGGELRNAYRSEVIQRIDALPGVVAAGGSKTIPLQGTSEFYQVTLPERTDVEAFNPRTHLVAGDYFRALGIPLLAGRVFAEADETEKAEVAIVNQAMARRYWPDGDAVGESLLLSGRAEVRIVGIVGDVRHDGIREAPEAGLYLLTHYGGRRSMKLFVRTASDPLPMIDDFRQVVWEVNPDQPVSRVTTLGQVVAETVAQPRFLTILLGSFAALAMVLAAVGVYGLTAYTVSRRTYEVGVRMALGARVPEVLRMIAVEGMVPILSGLAMGLLAARGLTQTLAGLLYGVDPADPVIFAAVALVLLPISLLATYIPARRAASVDPLLTMRAQ